MKLFNPPPLWFKRDRLPRVRVLTDRYDATYFLAFHFALKSLTQQRKVSFSSCSREEFDHFFNPATSIESQVKKWLDHWQPDLIFLNRFSSHLAIPLVEACLKLNIPTVYFIDDNLIEIPADIPELLQSSHAQTATIETRKQLLQMVNFIWSSTPSLTAQLQPLLPQKTFISTAYPPYLTGLINPPPKPHPSPTPQAQALTLGYMGSKGHNDDLESVADAIAATLSSHPLIRFETFGTVSMPNRLLQFGSRVKHHRPVGRYDQFLNYLAKLNWRIGLAPLIDHPFNRCKSPVKYLEYTACHIATIAARSGVYEPYIESGKNGILVEDNWQEMINDLIANPQQCAELVSQARVNCANRFPLTNVTDQIMNFVPG